MLSSQDIVKGYRMPQMFAAMDHMTWCDQPVVPEQKPIERPTAMVRESVNFETLFQQNEKSIFNLIYRMVGDYEDATDLTAQTFLHALRAFERFRGDADAYTWLYRIAVNQCKNFFRSRDRAMKHARLVSLDAACDEQNESIDWEIEDTRHTPERYLDNRELQDVLQQALMSLSPEMRTVILLCDVHGLSYPKIAQITDCTVEAIKSRIFRARSILRKILSSYLGNAV